MKEEMRALLRSYGNGNEAFDAFVDKCLDDFGKDDDECDATILKRYFINGEPAKDVAEALFVSPPWFSTLCARCLARIQGRWEGMNDG